MSFTISPTGVRLADDFRDNLIIDRYHPDLLKMRGSKLAQMRSENSEDVLTWNVFRSLAQIDPAFWFPRLHDQVFGTSDVPVPRNVGVKLWLKVPPPPALRFVQKDEDASEIDVVIETEHSVWFIEAKFKSDVSERTTNNESRDQVVRNLDVGSWYAGVRHFDFSLLIADERRSPRGLEFVSRYRTTKPTLVHRPDGLQNLRGVGLMRWQDLAALLGAAAELAPREDERQYAAKTLSWLTTSRALGV